MMSEKTEMFKTLGSGTTLGGKRGGKMGVLQRGPVKGEGVAGKDCRGERGKEIIAEAHQVRKLQGASICGVMIVIKGGKRGIKRVALGNRGSRNGKKEGSGKEDAIQCHMGGIPRDITLKLM